MRTPVLLLTLFTLAGCNHPSKRPVPLPSVAAVLAPQERKDAVVLREADSIDAIAPEAKPHTDAQRAAVAAAPAKDLAPVLAQFTAAAAADAKTIARLTKERDDARSMVDRVIRIGGYALAGILGAAAAASLFLAAQVPWLGPRISAALGAASLSIFAMVWAYEWTKQHPWVTAITGACVLVAAALAYANHIHDRK